MLVAHLLSAIRLGWERWENESNGCMKKEEEAGAILR